MPEIGQNLSHYSIVEKIGKGGMGEVFRAKDQKLGRDVAIKVLPEEFARDADRVARFQREAKLLASLNHPNIAAIYGLEESGKTNFLVMELVEGQTLADRIKAGPIPVEESLKLALQIAEALEAAHEKGIIHRDLKPANIKVTPDGKVKVLDFGLAKAFAGEQAELNLSNSPTLSDMATQQGVILGTAAYMSPEQARGKAVDKRADIWAFGCVLFEMLTGRAAFSGRDVTEILAAVIRAEPEWKSLPANLHWRLREVLERCLEKEPKNRYGVISDARVDLQKALADPSGLLVQPVTAGEPRRKSRAMLPWIVATAILSVIIGGVAVWKFKPSEPKQVTRFEYNLPEGQQFGDLVTMTFSISPDGRQFVYSTTKGIYLRSMDGLTAKLIPGAEENTNQPLFSPDGKWIGYFSVADKKWKKIPISGGAPVVLCDADIPLGASWGTDDAIVYAEQAKGIMRISANGGTPELIVKKIGQYLVHPQILSDGKTVLFGIVKDSRTFQIAVQSPKSGEPKVLLEGGNGRYLTTGHLVYGVRNSLYAAPFDLGKLEITGDSVPLIESVFRLAGIYTPQYATSNSGTLVYIQGESTAVAPGLGLPQLTLVWVDRKGKEVPIAAAPNFYISSKMSPDGTKVALVTVTEVATGEGRMAPDIWIWDFARETMTRLTFNGAMYPLWTPDGKRIVFMSSSRDKPGIYWKAADGTGQEERLGSEQNQAMLTPLSWSRDGKTLLLTEPMSFLLGKAPTTSQVAGRGATPQVGIHALSMEGDRKLSALLKEKYDQFDPKISPDGRWMAYVSDESGKSEIYVRPFPDVNKGKWQISTSGGDTPLWSPDGRELFYHSGDATMAVPVETEPTFKPGKPALLFRGTYFEVNNGIGSLTIWDISHDGKRFLMIKPPASTSATPTAASPQPKIIVVLNWFEELKQRVPVK